MAVTINYEYETRIRKTIAIHELIETPAEFLRKAGMQRIERLEDGDLHAR